MEKHFPYLLVLLFSLASVFYSCKKDSSGSGGGASVLSHVTSYKMFQDTSLYESWVNTYTGNLLTETMSKVNYNGSILHFKTNIEYNANRVSGIYSYDSTGTGWIKGYDVVVTSWSAEGLPAEIINTFYEASGDIHQQNITQFTYSGIQVTEKKQTNYWQGALALYQRTEYTYNQDARLVKEETFTQDSSLYSMVDITWQNNLVMQEHCSMPTVFINYKTVYIYSAGKLINTTQYDDDTPTVPDVIIDYSYDQNGCLVSEKNTIASTGEYNLWQYTYEPGQGNIRQVFEIGNAYETWNGNPDPYPSNPGKAKSKPLARDEIHLYY